MEAELIQLPKTLLDTLRQKAGKMGVSLEECLVDILTQGFDPEESVKAYMDASRFPLSKLGMG